MSRQAVLGLLSLAACVVLTELLLQRFAPIYTVGIQSAYKYDKELGITLRDSITMRRNTDHLEEIHTNRFGTADFHDDFSGYSGLVFALGDSYTQGTGLPYDESFPAQLDVMLNQDSSGIYAKRLAVVNLGLAAYGAEQSLLVLKRYAARLGKPYACLYLGSDLGYQDDLLFRRGDRHRHIVYGSPRWGPLAPFMIWLGNTQIIGRSKIAFSNRRLDRLEADAPKTKSTVVSPEQSVAEREWPTISRIVNECRADGARVVLGWAALPEPGGSYEWLASKAKADSIEFNDWYPRVNAVRAAMPSLEIWNPHSAGHYRGWVNGQIAAGFRDQLGSHSSH